MKKLISILHLLTCFSSLLFSQSVKDLFTPSKTNVYWLGIDYSHVKIIGDLNQFAEAGSISLMELKNKYFTGWNNLILNEPDKYDIKGMFRKEKLIVDLNAVTKINLDASIEEMETYNLPNYKKDDIEKFVSGYQLEINEGIGLMLIAEYLSKPMQQAKYHFVAINLANNDIILYDTFEESAGGFGFRNYWARSYYNVIIKIRDQKYKNWKNQYGSK